MVEDCAWGSLYESAEDVRNSVKCVIGESGYYVPDDILDYPHTTGTNLSFWKKYKASYCKIH